MSNENQFFGIVQDGKFQPLTSYPGPMGYTELTTESMQASVPPEGGRIELTEYDGKAIMVQGHGGGEWIYSARVVDEAGPILTAVVGRVFGQIALAKPEPPHGSTDGPAAPKPEELKTGMTSTEEMLIEARKGLHQEWVGLQILGRALTEQEKQRSDALGQAVELTDKALAVLGHDTQETE